MSRAWEVSVALTGLLLVGVVYGCIWYAIPESPVAMDWPIYGPLLFCPYALVSLGCWLSRSRLVRVLAVLVVLAGILIAGVALFDAGPTFSGGPAPAMPASALASGVLLVGQYGASVIAVLDGFAVRSHRDAESRNSYCP